VSDPATHPDWWPDVVAVRVEEPLEEGGEYVRVSEPMRFIDDVESVWVAERMEHLKEVRFRCTLTGSYASFALTPARDETFVEVETGIQPTNLKFHLLSAMSRSYWKRWLRDVLDALPKELERARA
jgi:hypothetical protein